MAALRNLILLVIYLGSCVDSFDILPAAHKLVFLLLVSLAHEGDSFHTYVPEKLLPNFPVLGDSTFYRTLIIYLH
ncbi:hypothetical protein EDD22DRAFT_906479 [Suillus occidentalis]|nr:hypothetical protein EDD22DRAFT_906479 [Suillus occidentalis]